MFYRDTLKLRGMTPVSMNAAPKTADGLFALTAGLPAGGGKVPMFNGLKKLLIFCSLLAAGCSFLCFFGAGSSFSASL